MLMELAWLAAGIVAGWALHYRFSAAVPLRLDGRDTPLTRRLRERIALLREPYRPTPWLYNRHLQLAWQWFSERRVPPVVYDREQRLAMGDGGTTALHWMDRDRAATVPTVVLLHGLIGDAQSVGSMAVDLQRLTGWRIVVCTRRGHGELPLTAPRLSTVGCTDDLREQLRAIQDQFPASPLFAVGVSAGSALLIRHLGEAGEGTPVRAAAAYCPGYALEAAWARVDHRYSRYLTRLWQRRLLVPNAGWFGDLDSYRGSLAATTLSELHATMFAIAGSSSLADYTERHCPMQVFRQMAVPVLLLNAEDDPICVDENVRDHVDAVRDTPDALLVRTRRGSHCTFHEGWRPRSWSHRLIAQYLQAANAILDEDRPGQGTTGVQA